MLTRRATFLIAAFTLLLVVSILNRMEALSLLSLSALIWIGFEWCFFRASLFAANQFESVVTRTVNGSGDDWHTIVTEQPFKVVLEGKLPTGSYGFRFLIRDTTPDTFEIIEGQNFAVVDCGSINQFRLAYEMKTSICGQSQFTGVLMEVSDHWGFFKADYFKPVHQKLTVLPFLIRPQTTTSVLKRNNLQQHVGRHRHRKSGISSELLGIRDYQPGDPPRTIAWKPTARLGKVMTCEFESEVPIRSTIIVDLAAYQFQGRPGPSAADRAIVASSSIAKLLLADRDPVAAVLMTSSGMRRIKHGGGERQLGKLLQYFMASSNPNPPLHKYTISLLVEVIFDNCVARFPELFDELFNTGPFRRSFLGLRHGRKNRVRGMLALVLEHLLKLEPGYLVRMQYDDQLMGNACLQYADKFGVLANSTTIAIDADGYSQMDWRFERQRVTKLAADALMDARSRAQDNELFVVVTPEPIDAMGVEILENSVRAAVASNHRVIFVAPQPPKLNSDVLDSNAGRILKQADKPFEAMSRKTPFSEAINRVGATFSRLDNPALMQLVAMEIGILQSGKRRGKVLRAR